MIKAEEWDLFLFDFYRIDLVIEYESLLKLSYEYHLYFALTTINSAFFYLWLLIKLIACSIVYIIKGCSSSESSSAYFAPTFRMQHQCLGLKQNIFLQSDAKKESCFYMLIKNPIG